MTTTAERILHQIKEQTVLLYMKGTPLFPQCGFSAQVVNILKLLKVRYAYVNILEHADIRAELPKIANWPTFPQLYIQGELVGGCDIVTELYQAKELLPLLEAVSAVGASVEATPA